MRKMWKPKPCPPEGGIPAEQAPLEGKIKRIVKRAEKVCPTLTRHFCGHITVSKSSPVPARCMAAVIDFRADVFDLPVREQVFILLHELEHFHRGHHVALPQWFNKRPRGCDAGTWEALLTVGADLEVNASVARRIGYRSPYAAMPGREEFKRLPPKGDAFQYALAMLKDDEAKAKSLSFFRNMAAPARKSPRFPKSRRHVGAKFRRRGLRV